MHKINSTALVVIVFCSLSWAVQMNAQGHFMADRSVPTQPESVVKMMDQLQDGLYRGAGVLQTSSGFISVETLYENAPSKLTLFNEQGRVAFTRQFNQIVNLKLSANGLFAAFFSDGRVRVLNTVTHEITSKPSTTVFNVTDDGQALYYNRDKNFVGWGQQTFPLVERPLKIENHLGIPHVFTRKNIYTLESGTLFKRHTFANQFHSSFEEGGILHVVEKRISPTYIDYDHLRGPDAGNLNTISQTGFKRHFAFRPGFSPLQKRSATSPLKRGPYNTPIRGPLNFDEENVPYVISNSYAQMLVFGGPYLHPGVDFQGDAGQDCFSVSDGVVKAILTTAAELHWRIAIATEDTDGETVGYLYAHLIPETIPFSVGDQVQEGDFIGQLADWNNPPYWNHVHFARLLHQGETWDGNWTTVTNPLIDVVNHVDNTAPIFENTVDEDLFAYVDDEGNILDPTDLKGEFNIISRYYDEDNKTHFQHDIEVHQVVLTLMRAEAPHRVVYDTLAYDLNIDLEYYASLESEMPISVMFSMEDPFRSHGDYDYKQFFHYLTHTDGDSVLEASDADIIFNSALYSDGDYWVRVKLVDASGNSTVDSMRVTFNNGVTGVGDGNNIPGPRVYLKEAGKLIFESRGIIEPHTYALHTLQGKLLDKGTLNPKETQHAVNLPEPANLADLVVITFRGKQRSYNFLLPVR